MAMPDKAFLSHDGIVKDLPPNMDILVGEGIPRKLHPSEVFNEYPSLSMIAQIIADYMITEYSVQKDEMAVYLIQNEDIAGITFDAVPANDGSMNREVQARMVGAFSEIEKFLLENDMTHNIDASPSLLTLGGSPDKIGMLELLNDFSRENGFHIGPTPEGSRLKSIGAFTIDDIQAAMAQERNRVVRHLRPSFRPVAQEVMAKAPIEVPPPPHSRAYDIATNFTQMLDLIVGENVFNFALSPRKDGYRYIIWPNDEDKIEVIEKFFRDLKEEATPKGVNIVAQDFLFRMKDEDAFQRLYDLVVKKFGTPSAEQNIESEANEEQADIEADFDDTEDQPFFWNRGVAQTAPEIICAMLFGLSRYRYGLEDTDWTYALSEKGDHVFTPVINDNEGTEYQRLMNMAQELAEEGGAWHNLYIGSDTATITASDLRMICSMLDRYAESTGVVFGTSAIDCVTINTPPENYLFETDTILKADPSLLHGLGDRTYTSHQNMLIDIEKLLQATAAKKFVAPHTTDDVYRAIIYPPVLDRPISTHPKPSEPNVG